MIHPICRVGSLEIAAPHTLHLAFDDHSSPITDFRPVLAGQWEKKLIPSVTYHILHLSRLISRASRTTEVIRWRLVRQSPLTNNQ